MNVKNFLNTIYLGDRYCESILIDCKNSEVKVQVNCITRIRSEEFNYSNADDLIDGYIVFENISSITFNPPGFIPDGFVNALELKESFTVDGKYSFLLSIDSTTNGYNQEILIEIHSKSIALEAFDKPGLRIYN